MMLVVVTLLLLDLILLVLVGLRAGATDLAMVTEALKACGWSAGMDGTFSPAVATTADMER